VVHRARSRLGEDSYHVLRNNCEHFCEWCASGQHRSYQIEGLVGRVEKGWLLFVGSFARIFAEKRLRGNPANPPWPAHKYRGILQTADSRLVGGIVTTELAEHTPHPLVSCSVPRPAGRFPARRPFR
jgi:ribosomal protein L37E